MINWKVRLQNKTWLLAMLAALTGGAALLLYRKCRCTKRHG